MRTYTPKPTDIHRVWFEVDADGAARRLPWRRGPIRRRRLNLPRPTLGLAPFQILPERRREADPPEIVAFCSGFIRTHAGSFVV